MVDNNQKSVELSDEEFTMVKENAQQFWERGASGNPPEFVIVMGGVGVGKTTIRKQNYAQGYVHFDYGDVNTALRKIVGEEHPKLTGCTVLACDLILRACIEGNKNMVIEVIGENEKLITPIIDRMKDIGYHVSIQAITGDIAESYQRHLKAVDEDADYISAYFTQKGTLASLNYFFNNEVSK
jgi:hypothetical protein